jgi:methylated-DNA-[protein]-cysteine S-methyltransferase
MIATSKDLENEGKIALMLACKLSRADAFLNMSRRASATRRSAAVALYGMAQRACGTPKMHRKQCSCFVPDEIHAKRPPQIGIGTMTSGLSTHLFETQIGWVGIAWSDAGLTRLQLPERDRAATHRRLLATMPRHGDQIVRSVENLPAEIAAIVAAITRYASGEAVDLSAIPVDLAGADDFQLAIYAAARKLGFGEVTTYGELAARAGHPGMARETGQALGSNPVPLVVPCHRILAAGGKIGGFSAPGGAATKERLLEMEGVHVGPPPPAQASFGF